ncbi:conserved hypothetical protein [delta proteobacterium NaphS2]|nr:conserved hypothetical protein [delta proteobacterium NaphS2]
MTFFKIFFLMDKKCHSLHLQAGFIVFLLSDGVAALFRSSF